MSTTLTLGLVKNHLNIDDFFTDDDNYLIQLMDAARNVILKKLNLTIEDFEMESICMHRDETFITNCLLNLTYLSNSNNYCCPINCKYRFCGRYYDSPIIQAMLLLIGNLYSNREPVAYISTNKVPYTIDYLLDTYKNYSI